MIPDFRAIWHNRKWNNFLSNREEFKTSPYSLSIYRSVLSSCLKRGYFFPEFDSNVRDTSKVRMFVRHDIDTLQCLKNMFETFKINDELNIPAAIFVRTDGMDYGLDELLIYKEILQNLKNRLGLHTSCYLAGKKWEEALNDEIIRFHKVFDFYPRWLTVHGLGDKMISYREELVNQVGASGQSNGFKVFLDAHSKNRKYTYIIQDCWLKTDQKTRFIYSDFKDVPPFRRNSENLILTHPCYWV